MKNAVQTVKGIERIVQTRDDLAVCLRTTVDEIAAVVACPDAHYTAFTVPKKSGGVRTIRPPRRLLRAIQRSVLDYLYSQVRISPCLHGGIRGRSIVTHAQAHVGRHMVATLDVRKFFASTSEMHIRPVLTAIGFEGGALEDLLCLVTLQGCLPEGSPASPLLANLAFAHADQRFIHICRKQNLRYSRYVDDIAVSGDRDFRDLRGPFVDAIEQSRYTVADEKVCFMPRSGRQVVTGLIVNDQLRPTKEFVSSLKHDIRLCLKQGALAMSDCLGVSVGALKSQLTGRVAHVRHVDPNLGNRLRGMLCGVDWRSTSADSIA